MKLPSSFRGYDGREEYKKHLEQTRSNKGDPQKKPDMPPTITGVNLADQQMYLILEGRKHGTYEYPDILVSKKRSLQGKNWHELHTELQNAGDLMLTIRQYVDFLNLLHSGKAFDGAGRLASKQELDHILDDIVTARFPWQAEWLDAQFVKQGKIFNKSLYISYHRIKNDGTFEKVTEPLEECLMSDKTPGIDLSDWLARATSQGLPPPDTGDGDQYYWHPRDGTVAGFVASAGRASLSCNWLPRSSNSALGVFACAEGAPSR